MSRPRDWHVLDLPGDPAPGDPYGVRALARRVRAVADDAERAEREARGLAGDAAVRSWIGAAGDVFRGALDDFPGQLRTVADSYGLAADALDRFAVRLDQAQAQADRALHTGRSARAALASLQGQLSSARARARSADAAVQQAQLVQPPDPEQVRQAVRNAQWAASEVSSLSGRVTATQSQVDAARRMAEEARQLRESAAGEATARLQDASDAGIAPKSRWQRFKEAAAKAWEVTITVAKVAVAVLGIVVLIIGGPLAWVVVGLSVLVLADALARLSRGEGSWGEVGLAALGLIPGTRGLTSAGALRSAWSANGALGVAGHLGEAGKALAVGGVASAGALWRGRSLIPVLARQAPGAAAARITGMAADLRHGTPGALKGFVAGFGQGSGVVGRLRTGTATARSGFRDGAQTFLTTTPAGAAQAARNYQGSLPYLGVDRWEGTVLPAGTRLEAGYEGVGSFVVPAGTADDIGRSGRAWNEGLQIGSRDGLYRTGVIGLEVVGDVPAATGTAAANVQYGAGGLTQHYVPDMAGRLLAGDIVAVGEGGQTLLPFVDDAGRVKLIAGSGDVIAMHDLVPGPDVWQPERIDELVKGVRTVVDAVRRPVGIGVKSSALAGAVAGE